MMMVIANRFFKPSRVLVQCIGNRLRWDDGAGPMVGERLRALGPPPWVEIREHWGEGSRLLQEWDAVPWVLLVDSASSGAPPGTLHHFAASDQIIPKNFCYYDTHRFGVAEAVELARVLDCLPPHLHLYAIEGQCFENGEGLTSEVDRAVTALAHRLHGLLLAGGSPVLNDPGQEMGEAEPEAAEPPPH